MLFVGVVNTTEKGVDITENSREGEVADVAELIPIDTSCGPFGGRVFDLRRHLKSTAHRERGVIRAQIYGINGKREERRFVGETQVNYRGAMRGNPTTITRIKYRNTVLFAKVN